MVCDKCKDQGEYRVVNRYYRSPFCGVGLLVSTDFSLSSFIVFSLKKALHKVKCPFEKKTMYIKKISNIKHRLSSAIDFY